MNILEYLLLGFAFTAMLIIALAWSYFLLKTAKLRLSTKVIDPQKDLEILKLEFEYAKDTSIKAQEDRLTLVNFYLGLYAAVGTISFGLKDIVGNKLNDYIPLGFLFLTLISYVFILFMVRLRQAWIESVRIMNKIKNYFFIENPHLLNYIVWTEATIPKAEKFNTLNFFSALLISALGSLALGLCMILYEFTSILILIIVLVNFVIGMNLFWYMLKYNK